MQTIPAHRKFNGKIYRFIGTYTKSDAEKMARRIRGPKSFARVVKTPHGYAEYFKYAVYARLEG